MEDCMARVVVICCAADPIYDDMTQHLVSRDDGEVSRSVVFLLSSFDLFFFFFIFLIFLSDLQRGFS